ncbi:acyl-CoA carboxylase subunit epsilon [Blastococcus sp. SYSU DS0617]
MSEGAEQTAPATPLLRVVKGEPSTEELAALTVVVAALSQRRERRRPTPVGAWASYGRSHRATLRTGPGGWRAAGGPA